MSEKEEVLVPTDTEIESAWNDEEAEARDDGEQETLEADQPKEDIPVQKETAEKKEPEGGQAGADQLFTLKHLDETRTVSRDEIIKLAQQGMDYDRVRGERDQLRANRNRAAAQTPAETREQAGAQARRADMGRFIQKFPAVKPEEIPKEVWTEVAKGDSLAAAYTEYRNRKLEAELAGERQNRANAQKTTGSLSTNGAGKRDEIDKWWNDD